MPEAGPRADTALAERLRFDRRLEAVALDRLRRLDIAGSRRAFEKLVSRVDLAGAAGPDRAAAILALHDLLQQVRRILDPRDPGVSPSADDEGRWRLIGEFADLDDRTPIARRFLAAVDRMLEPWRSRAGGGRPVVHRARLFIRENYHGRISLSAVAERLNVSPNYLSRQFRRETGSTLTSFIHRVRLEHARALLADGGRSISEIAYRVGYQTYRDFHRNFVKYENVSPSHALREAAPPSGGEPAARNSR